MIRNNRVIFEDDTTLIDITIAVNNFRGANTTLPIVAADDFIYLGAPLPFNHKFIQVSTANNQASILSVDVYNGNEWKAAVDVIDETSLAGASFGQTGLIHFTPDRNESWTRRDTEDITELSTLRIYNYYWARLKFSVDFNVLTAITFLGHRFNDDEQLFTLYPEFAISGILEIFESGKTDWIEQEILAAEMIIRDLIKFQDIITDDQLLNPEKLQLASLHKMAEIIYRSMGENRQDEFTQATKDYKEAINAFNLEIDRDRDGRVDFHERITEGTVSRR